MNYGEELCYWYLRLNGFFPVMNFVLHRVEDGDDYRSDVDLIAVRPPHVFEAIGGQEEDWDNYLKTNLDFGQCVGILCEVKTGKFRPATIFREHSLTTGIERIGLFQKEAVDEVVRVLRIEYGFPSEVPYKTIAKLLISEKEEPVTDSYLHRSIKQVEDFILNRVAKYSAEKFASRMFFPSPMFQLLIAQVHAAQRQRLSF